MEKYWPNVHHKDKNWFRLDNAGKVYPAIISHRRTSLFRISVSLVERVNVSKLQQALNKVIRRFPYFNVQMKAGLFWYFFETNEHTPLVEQDSIYPCMAMNVKKNRMYLFRVRAYNNRIAVEFSHVLTDGTGALIFLKTLICEYFRELGITIDISSDPTIFDINEDPDPQEYEDSFKQVYNKKLPYIRKQKRAFHLPDILDWPGHYSVITGIVSIRDVIKLTKEYSVSLTEFLAALLIDSFQEYCEENIQMKKFKPIVINIPVNLRPIFNTKTMKNFFIPLEPSIDPRLGHYTFREILTKVHHYMRYEVDNKMLNQQITRNVKGEMNAILRVLPLVVKNMLLTVLYNFLGENNYSSGISNLGNIVMPKEINGKIDKFEFIPAPSTGVKTKATVASFGDKMYISFGRLIKDAPIEKLFFRKMRKMGIHVKIESNRG
ncbi:MAG: hypothetical protein PF518_11700 [Spirochaetaceae bacterium]|jgi:hypothetical protein|nr:hypothetical protein [Spirochaetaceae bacterium]